ncbi:uncharacterized protein [Miscanthus floridulus]|uniref:uncharacterized protein isoform X2 n=1 Tax=Miscanthus floridulus TaxID=154761 RepID=UPI00345B0C14
MVWKVKAAKEGKKQKKVSFADPIATELKPPKHILPDDSIMLIKGNHHSQSMLVYVPLPINDILDGETCLTIDPSIPPHTAMEADKEYVQEDNAATSKDQLNMENGAVGTERVQQALAQILKLMEIKLALPDNNLFERPIDKSKMEAIQVLIEQGNKKLKKSSINRKMTAQVGMDA